MSNVVSLNPHKPKLNECSHSVLKTGDGWVCCAQCGEILDPIEVLSSFLSADGAYRSKLMKRKRQIEQIEIDLRRQTEDLRKNAKQLKAITGKIINARNELKEVNQKIAERAPKLDDLMSELDS